MNNDDNLSSQIANSIVKKAVVKYAFGAILASLPILFPIFVAIILIVVLIGIFGAGSEIDDSVAANNSSCVSGFSGTDTSLSKDEFKSRLENTAASKSQWKIFADNADDIYDHAKSRGVNPEYVIALASKEGGGSPVSDSTTQYNYWGWNCPNGMGCNAGFSSFMVGVDTILDDQKKKVDKYPDILDWYYKAHYSYLGTNGYWLNPGNWGDGGCIYKDYLAEFYPGGVLPDSVVAACAKDKPCSGSSCTKFKHDDVNFSYDPYDDQLAYSKFMVKKLTVGREEILGVKADDSTTCDSGGSVEVSTTLKDTVVLINPSHQVNNVTTTSNTSKYKTEKDSMFVFGDKIYNTLQNSGVTTYIAESSGDIDVGSGDNCWYSSDGSTGDMNSAWERCGPKQIKWLINKNMNESNVYIALHSNANNGSLSGPIVYYADDNSESRKLGDSICKAVIDVYSKNDISINVDSCNQAGAQNSSEARRYYEYGGKGAAVLIEIGFHDNPTNQKFIENNGQELAEAVIKGIDNYLSS